MEGRGHLWLERQFVVGCRRGLIGGFHIEDLQNAGFQAIEKCREVKFADREPVSPTTRKVEIPPPLVTTQANT